MTVIRHDTLLIMTQQTSWHNAAHIWLCTYLVFQPLIVCMPYNYLVDCL